MCTRKGEQLKAMAEREQFRVAAWCCLTRPGSQLHTEQPKTKQKREDGWRLAGQTCWAGYRGAERHCNRTTTHTGLPIKTELQKTTKETCQKNTKRVHTVAAGSHSLRLYPRAPPRSITLLPSRKSSASVRPRLYTSCRQYSMVRYNRQYDEAVQGAMRGSTGSGEGGGAKPRSAESRMVFLLQVAGMGGTAS